MFDDQNPYSPPADGLPREESLAALTPQSARPLIRILGWNVAAASNMVFCWMAGWSQTEGAGRGGMLAGCLFILAFGSLIVFQNPQVGKIMISGAIPVAVTQFFPMLQMISGLMAIGIVTSLGLAEENSRGMPSVISSQPGAFLATCLTAMPMLIICGAAGFALLWLGRVMRGRSAGTT